MKPKVIAIIATALILAMNIMLNTNQIASQLKDSGLGFTRFVFGAISFIILVRLVDSFLQAHAASKKSNFQTIKEANDIEDIKRALKKIPDESRIVDYKETIISQLDEMEKKVSALRLTLSARFSPTELAYQRFMSALVKSEEVIKQTSKSLVSKLTFLAIEDDDDITISSAELEYEKIKVINTYHQNIGQMLNISNMVLLKLSQLMLEISQLDTITQEDLNKMSSLAEIDSLIEQTKYYK